MLKLKVVFFLMLIMALVFTSSIRIIKAENVDITINSDGSINPETAPIVIDGAKYLITADITGSITIRRSNILLDGGGHTLQGIGDVYETENATEYGVFLINIESMWVQNLTVKGFNYGIYLQSALKCVITECSTTENGLDGIKLDSSFDNFILKNTITSNADDGIQLFRSGNNSVAGNLIRDNNFETAYTTIKDATPAGIQVNALHSPAVSVNNLITGNTIEGGITGIILGYESSSTTVIWNTLKENSECGIEIDMKSTGNVVHHNNFIKNTHQAVAPETEETLWDDGKQGNYWSDYNGTDSDQNGIGDTAYDSIDRYPLLNQVSIEDAQISSPEIQLIAPSPSPDSQASPSPDSHYEPDSMSPLDIILGLLAALFLGVILVIIVTRIERRQKHKHENKEIDNTVFSY